MKTDTFETISKVKDFEKGSLSNVDRCKRRRLKTVTEKASCTVAYTDDGLRTSRCEYAFANGNKIVWTGENKSKTSLWAEIVRFVNPYFTGRKLNLPLFFLAKTITFPVTSLLPDTS